MGTCLLFTWYTWYTYFYTRLQKVGKTEMNSTCVLETDWFSCDETEFCLVSDPFIFSSNTVETEVPRLQSTVGSVWRE